MVRRRVKWVKCYSNAAVDDVSYNLLQERARCLKTRIGIDLYQVDLELVIEHEVEAKYLKGVMLKHP